jgi:hypothetical protein
MESRLLRQVVRRLHKLRLKGTPLFWFKTKGEPAGIPDLIICCNGRFVGIELKTLTGKLRKDQEHVRDRIIGAGGKYYVLRSPQEIERIVEEVLNGI